MRKFDVLLHPVRMRIVFEMTAGKLTASELAERLPDIAQATLYRHLKKLAEAGVLDVVEENPVRGTVERVYALGSSSLAPEDLRGVTSDDLRHALTLIVSSLMGDLESYLQNSDQAELTPLEDGLDFTRGQLNLTDEEFSALRQEIWSVVEPRTKYVREQGRKPRSLTYLFIPME